MKLDDKIDRAEAKRCMTKMGGSQRDITVPEINTIIQSIRGDVTLSGFTTEGSHLDSHLHEDPEAVVALGEFS